MTEKRFNVNNRIDCKNFGFDCFKCEYYNNYSNYCTKFKIWVD